FALGLTSDRTVIPVLKDLIKRDHDPKVKRAAVRGLGRVEKNVSVAVSLLIELLSVESVTDDEISLRSETMFFLITLGGAAIPALVEVPRDPKYSHPARAAAMWIIGQIVVHEQMPPLSDETLRSCVHTFAEMIDQEDQELRLGALDS